MVPLKISCQLVCNLLARLGASAGKSLKWWGLVWTGEGERETGLAQSKIKELPSFNSK